MQVNEEHDGTFIEVDLEQLLVPSVNQYQVSDSPEAPRIEFVKPAAHGLIRVDWELDGRPSYGSPYAGWDKYHIRPAGLYHVEQDHYGSEDPEPHLLWREPGILEVPRRARVGEVLSLSDNPEQYPVGRGRVMMMPLATWRGRPCLVVRSSRDAPPARWCVEKWWVEGVGLVRVRSGLLDSHLELAELRLSDEAELVEVNGVNLDSGNVRPPPVRGQRLLKWFDLDHFAHLWDGSDPGWVLLDHGEGGTSPCLEPYNQVRRSSFSFDFDIEDPGAALFALLVERMLAAGAAVVPEAEEQRLRQGWEAAFDTLDRRLGATPECPVCGGRTLERQGSSWGPFPRFRCSRCGAERDDGPWRRSKFGQSPPQG